MLLRLDDAHSVTLTPGQVPVLADLESAGLYYPDATADGEGRVVFVAPVRGLATTRMKKGSPAEGRQCQPRHR